MYPVIPLLALADEVAVGASSAPFAALTALVSGLMYLFTSSTACWVRQGSAWLITNVSKANTTTGDYFSITIDGVTVAYQLNITGSDAAIATPAGVTTLVQVDIHTATTAITVAALVRTAILATQTTLSVTDNGDGTLTVQRSGQIVTMTENVTNAGFTVAKTTLVASAAAGSMFVPAATPILLDGRYGEKVSVIQDAAGGKASLAPVKL